MNVDNIVRNRYLSWQVQSEAKKAPNNHQKPDVFQQKLQSFRQENLFDRISPKKKAEKSEDADQKKTTERDSALYSMQLYDAWDENLTAEEALEKLDSNLEKIGDNALSSRLSPQEVIEHIAAQRAIYGRFLSSKGTEEQMAELDNLIVKHTEQYAKGLSESVGGFFEKHGIKDEKEKIYLSVVDGVQRMTTAYEKFSGSSAIDLNALVEKSMSSKQSLSNELRKAFAENNLDAQQQPAKGRYTLQEMSDLHKLARFSYFFGQTGTIKIQGEEELGVRLGTAYIKAFDLIKHSCVDKDHESAFMNAITKQMDSYMDKVDELLVDAQKTNTGVARGDNKTNPLNRDAVQEIVNWMYSYYDTTKSIEKGIAAGKEFAVAAYLSRASSHINDDHNSVTENWKKVVRDTMETAKPGTILYRACIATRMLSQYKPFSMWA